MATLTWEVFRTVTTPVAAATFAVAAGLSAGILLAWSTRRSMERHVVNLNGQMCDLRDKQDKYERTCFVHRMWTADRTQVDDLLPEEN